MLEIRGLSVEYPDKTAALQSISLTLQDGESVALMGANGAGKTTLLMALVGILPSEGVVTLGDITLEKSTLHLLRSRMGTVFQNPDDQLFMPTIYEDVAFGLRNQGVNAEETKARVTACLKELGIGHLAEKSALRLSGGEKRMAALATVLVMEPEVLLLDEPTAFLDPKARRTLIETLHGLPHTKLIATHDLTFALETCPRTVLLKNGSLFGDGDSKTLLFDEQIMSDCGVEAIRRCYF